MPVQQGQVVHDNHTPGLARQIATSCEWQRTRPAERMASTSGSLFGGHCCGQFPCSGRICKIQMPFGLCFPHMPHQCWPSCNLARAVRSFPLTEHISETNTVTEKKPAASRAPFNRIKSGHEEVPMTSLVRFQFSPFSQTFKHKPTSFSHFLLQQ